MRAHLESAFNDATANLQSGPNVMGGAKFARDLVGNPQAGANVESALRALPNGDAIADGFNRFLDTMQATGYKPAKGSDTAFNQHIQKDLKNGTGMLGTAIEQASQGGLGLKQALSDKWAAIRTGQNTAGLARLLTDPSSIPLLRQLASEAPTGQRAQLLALRLASMGRIGAAQASGQ